MTTRAESTPPDERDWNALCDAAGSTPFVRPSWILPWLASFAPGRGVFVTARRGDELVGILPLRSRIGLTWSATNWHTPLYQAVARDEEAETELLRHAARLAPALILRFVDEASTLAAAVPRVAADEQLSLVRRTMLESPRVDVGASSWEEYERSLSKSMVKTLRRRRRRLEELGTVTVEVVREGEEIEPRLAEGLELEHAGWKGRSGTSIASDPRVLAFYRELARSAAREGRLALSFLRLDGRAIAFHLDLVDGGTVFGLKGTYAEDMASLSPSRVLRHERIRAAFEEGYTRYEFLGADEPYKAEWANAATKLGAFELYRRSPQGHAVRLVRTRGRALARRALQLRQRRQAAVGQE